MSKPLRIERDGMIYERLPLGTARDPLDLDGYLRWLGLKVVSDWSGWWRNRKCTVWTERASQDEQ